MRQSKFNVHLSSNLGKTMTDQRETQVMFQVMLQQVYERKTENYRPHTVIHKILTNHVISL